MFLPSDGVNVIRHCSTLGLATLLRTVRETRIRHRRGLPGLGSNATPLFFSDLNHTFLQGLVLAGSVPRAAGTTAALAARLPIITANGLFLALLTAHAPGRDIPSVGLLTRRLPPLPERSAIIGPTGLRRISPVSFAAT